jgi:CRISPR-associated exonuclease Cas4
MGIHGVADLVLETSTHVYPVEFKLGRNIKNGAQRMQLMAYGLAAAASFNKVFDKGFILHSDPVKTNVVLYKDQDRDQIDSVVKSIQQMGEAQRVPSTSASQYQCEQCEYLTRCNDRF